MQRTAPASTGQWQDRLECCVFSLGWELKFPIPSTHSAFLQHCSIHHLSPPAHQHDGAGVCCFVPQNSDGAGVVQDKRLLLVRQKDSAHCLLASMWARSSLVEGMGLRLSSGLRLLPFSLDSPLGCRESWLMAEWPHFPPALEPRQKIRREPLGQR